MSKRLATTPRSIIRNAYRRLFLRSRERAACVKAHNNTCVKCGRKGSVAKGREVKIQVHHIHGIEWEELEAVVRKTLLCNPSMMQTLCKECHKAETYK